MVLTYRLIIPFMQQWAVSIDLNELLIFAKVAEKQSFTEAARNLGLPKATVSRKVRDLEERLGTRLLARTTRRVSPTEAGQVLQDYCTRIAQEVVDAEAAVSPCSRRREAPCAFPRRLRWGWPGLRRLPRNFWCCIRASGSIWNSATRASISSGRATTSRSGSARSTNRAMPRGLWVVSCSACMPAPPILMRRDGRAGRRNSRNTTRCRWHSMCDRTA